MTNPSHTEIADAPSTLVLRGWTGEFFQIRELAQGDLRLWHPDGTYYGRLITDDAHTDEAASGTVYGPSGLYLADASRGRLRVDARRCQARGATAGYSTEDLESPGDLEPTERRWPRRG
ncbi:MAG: hypothetical protein QOC86_2909 [Gaiellales bacterium]|jgi:hypothetical protein|nr:hypothetical protein [Gaiellales bacterium]